jgi:hypothetical protein
VAPCLPEGGGGCREHLQLGIDEGQHEVDVVGVNEIDQGRDVRVVVNERENCVLVCDL